MKTIGKLYTAEDLKKIFEDLGVREGMTLEVHAAMSRFGYIAGGAQTFGDVLLSLLGEEGTLVVPLQRGDADDPASFRRPPLAYELQETLRNASPAFDKRSSDTYKMSKIYENLRRREGAFISDHPSCGFLAIGKYAEEITKDQPLDFPLGEGSPIEKLIEHQGYCLLCGVSYDNMTSLHYGETLSPYRPVALNGAKISEEGKDVWKKYLIRDVDSDDGFEEIGKILEEKSLVKRFTEGELELRLLPVAEAVKEASEYYRNRMKYYTI